MMKNCLPNLEKCVGYDRVQILDFYFNIFFLLASNDSQSDDLIDARVNNFPERVEVFDISIAECRVVTLHYNIARLKRRSRTFRKDRRNCEQAVAAFLTL